MRTTPIRILFIGVRPILADALSLLLATDGSINVLGTATDADELPAAAIAAADVLIVDGRARTDLGAAIRWWKQRCPRCRVIAVDVDADKASVEWIAGGLDGFVVSDAPTRDLVDAVHRSMRNEALCPSTMLKKVVDRIRMLSAQDGDKPTPLNLTAREIGVLHLLAEGLSNKEIAVKLDISLYTVKNHVHSVLDKLKVSYRREAVRCAMNRGLLKPSTRVVLPVFSSRSLEKR